VAQSLVYCPDYLERKTHELSDEILVPVDLFEALMEQLDTQSVLYLNLQAVDHGRPVMVTLGAAHTYDTCTIFVPQWILDMMWYHEGEVRVEPVLTVDIPVATKVVIEVQEAYAMEIDLRECVERAMVNLHSVQEGSLYAVVDGDVEMMVQVVSVETEMGKDVGGRIVEGELEVEFVNPFLKAEQTQAQAQAQSPAQPAAVPPPSPLVAPLATPLATPLALEADAEHDTSILPPAVPRAGSLPIALAWDYFQGEERQRYIREARMKRFQ
jgi:hypothetical protein